MITRHFASLVSVVILTASFSTGCGSGAGPSRQVPVGGSPTAPGGGGGGTVTLSTPAAVSPANGEQLSTLRPTLVVQNSTGGTGARTYQFQVSDRQDFTLGSSLTTSFLVAINETGVVEGGDGRTSFTVPSELQPTTRMYWRARSVLGSSSSEWSSPAMFKTKTCWVQPARRIVRPADLLRGREHWHD